MPFFYREPTTRKSACLVSSFDGGVVTAFSSSWRELFQVSGRYSSMYQSTWASTSKSLAKTLRTTQRDPLKETTHEHYEKTLSFHELIGFPRHSTTERFGIARNRHTRANGKGLRDGYRMMHPSQIC